MIIDGRLIASEIKSHLKDQVSQFKKKHIIPHLAVILIGDDPGSIVYINQKKKVGEEIGVKVTIYNYPFMRDGNNIPLTKEIYNLLDKLNKDPKVHGIIIQRPIPIDISKNDLDLLVTATKDVDGFHPKTEFTPPVASAIFRILEYVYMTSKSHFYAIAQKWDNEKFIKWLKEKKILVIGRGETAGRPIANYFRENSIKITVAHSQTTNLEELCLRSKIIISCVGKAKNILRQQNGVVKYFPIVRHDMVNKNTILIGVGLHPENDKLQTDYNQNEISTKVAFYTPVPGGVGPVNVACLFENLINSSKLLK